MRDESLFFLFSAITRIKGVGGATAKALTRLLPAATEKSGRTIPIIRDILFHLPVGHIDRRFTSPLHSAPDGVVATFVVEVESHEPPKRGSRKPYKVLCTNDTGDITLAFFHAQDDYLKNILPVGQKRVISGKVERFDGHLQMAHPDIIVPVSQLAEVQRLEAVYPLTLGLTSRRIAKIVEQALESLPLLPEWIRTDILGSWPSWKHALDQAHHPQTPDDLLPAAPARMRLAYDEIMASQLHLALIRRRMQKQSGTVICGTGTLTSALRESLPYTLTAGQEQVLEEIYADMKSGGRMTRLLQGDVGSGKTIVALFAMLKVAEQGLQSALMAPTELVARQHYKTISRLVGINVVLLTGNIKGKARQEALEAISSGDAAIVVGTHALFQEHVEFKNLTLTVIDEQHRFGVAQRMALMGKGDAPHVLHMTATPIPRSLTMMLYGDMDCSLLKEKPANRQPIATRVIPLSRYGDMMERLKAALDKGEKVYWICPLIEENPEIDPLSDAADNIAAAETRHTEFAARFGNIVGLVHGRMKAQARDAAMQDFASGKTRLLVATTVVEVGVDIPDATIMVIEQAERFGLSQIHQLRGRVGRGAKASSCVLLYNEGIRHEASGMEEDVPNPSIQRLSILRESEDGFKIAEVDLSMRGGGELLGTRQSGMPRFVFINVAHHYPLLEKARDDIGALLDEDPELTGQRGKALRLLLQVFEYE